MVQADGVNTLDGLKWGTKEEIERRRRILLSVWAYAYEYLGESLVSDAVFDEECKKVDLSVSTGNKKMDKWFKKHFTAFTGMWVTHHPHQTRLHALAGDIINANKLTKGI